MLFTVPVFYVKIRTFDLSACFPYNMREIKKEVGRL